MIYEYVIISSFRMADFDRHCDHKQPLFAAKKVAHNGNRYAQIYYN